MSDRLHAYRNPSALILLLIIMSLVSCQEEESFTFEEQQSILMSTGWKLDRLILHFEDNRQDEESDTLVLLTLRSDKEEQQMTVYTGRWIVFENDSIALAAFNLDYYSRPDAGDEWELYSKDNTAVGWTDWGSDSDGNPYLSLRKEWPILIRLVNEHQFILEDAYRIETTEELYSGSAIRTYRLGAYPSGTIKSIDAVYRAAGPDEGPNWFPPWSHWPD
jgi:hypothetical protein